MTREKVLEAAIVQAIGSARLGADEIHAGNLDNAQIQFHEIIRVLYAAVVAP